MVRGKRGRGVPVILTSQMKSNLDLLIEKREECNIKTENPYLFPIPKTASSCMRAADILRSHAKLCGAQIPGNIRSVNLRKHVATMSQLLNLNGNDVEGLATFMGHNVDVHKEYYRLPDNILQVAKISKLLLALESGKLKEIKGKNFDDIDVDEPLSDTDLVGCGESDEEEIHNQHQPLCNENETLNYENQSLSNTTLQDVGRQHPSIPNIGLERKEGKIVKFPKRRKTCTKNPWSPQEREVVANYFQKHILLKKVPNKEECSKCLTENPCLSDRSWSLIKFQVKNMFSKY